MRSCSPNDSGSSEFGGTLSVVQQSQQLDTWRELPARALRPSQAQSTISLAAGPLSVAASGLLPRQCEQAFCQRAGKPVVRGSGLLPRRNSGDGLGTTVVDPRRHRRIHLREWLPYEIRAQ